MGTVMLVMKTANVVKVFVQTPCEALRPIIKRFLIVEFPVAHQDSHLPDTGLVGVFRFNGDCVLDGGIKAPQAAITGLYDAIRGHDHGRNSAAVIAAFTATGAAAFTRHPLDEFSNATTDMERVLGRTSELNRVHEQLAEARTHARRIEVVERFLLAHATKARTDPLVSAVASWIEEAQGIVHVEPMARRVGLSQSALERRSRQFIGASPKKFASIVRLQHVLRLRARGDDFTSIAYQAGYCDQPHFIKDFKRFTGVAPEAFFKRAAGS
jgi:AraC-like DNA-binding protein